MIFLQILRLLAVMVLAFGAGKLASKLKMPVILGWLIAGMVLGPHALNLLDQQTLDAAGVVVMEKSARHMVEVDYSTWQRLEYFLRSAPVIIEHTEFGASVVCTLMVRVADEENLLAEITRVTDGKAETLEDGTLFYPWAE